MIAQAKGWVFSCDLSKNVCSELRRKVLCDLSMSNDAQIMIDS